MAKTKKALARRAVKTTARHSAHGAAAKLKRSPVRAVTLLSLGGLVGALAGWIAGRGMATADAGTGIYGESGPS